jgi:hypothetical protein
LRSAGGRFFLQFPCERLVDWIAVVVPLFSYNFLGREHRGVMGLPGLPDFALERP